MSLASVVSSQRLAGGVRPVGLRGAALGAPAATRVVHDEHGRAGSVPLLDACQVQ